jgi:hypothetical protein
VFVRSHAGSAQRWPVGDFEITDRFEGSPTRSLTVSLLFE